LAIAPNANGRMWLYRPIMADPPLFRMADIPGLTLGQIADAHELLDLREEVTRRHEAKAEKERNQKR
jgi:hypothetical protein